MGEACCQAVGISARSLLNASLQVCCPLPTAKRTRPQPGPGAAGPLAVLVPGCPGPTAARPARAQPPGRGKQPVLGVVGGDKVSGAALGTGNPTFFTPFSCNGGICVFFSKKK